MSDKMMMQAENMGLKTGDVVRISGAYFKNDNGFWFVDRTPGDCNWCGSDWSLKRLCKNGKVSTGKNNLAFWPLKSYCSDRMKNALANDWNLEHAKIEKVPGFPLFGVIEHFQEEEKKTADYIEWNRWRSLGVYDERCDIQLEFFRQIIRELKESEN